MEKPNSKQNPELEGSSGEVLAAVEALREDAAKAEARVREHLIEDAKKEVADAQEPGQA